MALVKRGDLVRSFYIDRLKEAITGIVASNMAREGVLYTDESRPCGDAVGHVSARETVRHSSGMTARGDVRTSTIEGCFSVFKRGMRGAYQHYCEKHQHAVSPTSISGTATGSPSEWVTSVARSRRWR